MGRHQETRHEKHVAVVADVRAAREACLQSPGPRSFRNLLFMGVQTSTTMVISGQCRPFIVYVRDNNTPDVEMHEIGRPLCGERWNNLSGRSFRNIQNARGGSGSAGSGLAPRL